MSRIKALILLTVFIDIIGLGVIIPILPFYVASFGASPVVVTLLFSVYAACSFFSAPIIGGLSDRFGRRPMLIVSIVSTAMGWLIFASATNLILLFTGRIIDGLAAGNMTIAQGYLTDIARNDKERTTNLGLIGVIFGIGFIVGPLIGGVLSTVSHSFPFWFVGLLASFNAILAYFFLPETHTNRGVHARRISINPFRTILRVASNKTLRPNFIAWFFFGLAIASFQSIFALFLGMVFNFGSVSVGIIYTGMGVVIALNQGFGLKHFWLKYFHEPDLELWILPVFVLGFLLTAIPVTFYFFIGLIFTTFGQSVLRVIMTSQIASRANPHNKGEVLGVTSSLTSMSMALGPLLAGPLFVINPSLPFVMSAIYLSISFFVLYMFRETLPTKLSEDQMINTEI